MSVRKSERQCVNSAPTPRNSYGTITTSTSDCCPKNSQECHNDLERSSVDEVDEETNNRFDNIDKTLI